MRTVVYNLFSLPSPSYPVNNPVWPLCRRPSGRARSGHCFPCLSHKAERYIFYLTGIHMEHTAKNRERDASSEMASGRARKRRQGMDELVELIGLPGAIELIRAKGGTSFSVPLGITLRGQEQREKLVQIIGREQARREKKLLVDDFQQEQRFHEIYQENIRIRNTMSHRLTAAEKSGCPHCRELVQLFDGRKRP